MRNRLLKAFVLVLVLAMTSIYCLSGISLPSGDGGNNTDASFNFNTEDIIKSLKEEFISSINQDLLKTVEDSKLSGSVNVIITLSNGSLVNEYNKKNSKLTLAEYLESAESKEIANKAIARQDKLANELISQGLISPVKYHYTTITDGIYVSTTYENLAAICSYSGVDRVILSDTYLPASAVENPVNVWDTGIFNSSDVDYTGKGTIVAILDTGCDYTHSAFTTHQVQNVKYGRDYVAGIFPNTLAYAYDNSVEVREVYYGNITKDKILYGYDYADKDPDIMPMASEHGTHVAGIIGGKDSTITGVAVDTQFAIMKVFSDYKEGADDGDIMAALEDCVKLSVDAINMSLGTSCGYTIERDIDDLYKNDIYDSIEKAGISLIVAASNDYSSAYGSEFGNTNKVENPDSGTVGAPSTYHAALSVASINGNKDKYMYANGEKEIFFHEAFNQNAKEFSFFDMLGVQEGVTDTYEYVTVPGYGSSVNYSALDVKGKIALVRRGDISFEEKVLFAANAGAAAIIIYNNVYGDIIMTVGNNPRIPVVSIGKDDGEYLAQQAGGKLEFNGSNIAGPFMSDFSSWGPTPDLKLKPEITAHGGNIYSSVPGGGYDKLSGTSMAAPNMCGIIILIRQYVKDNYPSLSTTEVRDMVNELCMSTATIALDKYSNPYSPRKQGAGIADILKATTTKAYLYTENSDGTNSGKTKLELGDDAKRSGVYTMSFKLVNLSNSAVSYELGNYTMTESLSADKKYVAERAYMLDSSAEYTVSNGSLSGNTVTVQGGQTAEISVRIKLSKADKAYLNDSFPNGMYVEGFITLADKSNNVDLNVPFLAFYGDWSDAPIFDKDYYLVETEAHNNAIDDDDKIKADYYATTPLGLYYYDYILPLGSYLYKMSPDFEAIPATQEHASMSYFPWTINGIYAIYTGLLRGARELDIEIVDTTTGKVVWSQTQYNAYKSHARGSTPMPYVSNIELSMLKMTGGIPDLYSVFGANNTQFKVTMKAHLDWDNGERNVNDTYSFSFTVDYQAPTITGSHFYTKYNTLTKKTEYYVDLTVYDNHYAMSVRPVAGYYRTDTAGNVMLDDDGEPTLSFRSLADLPTPVYQETRGSTSVVTIEITDYLDLLKDSITPNGICFYVDDYALNTNICYVPFPEIDASDLAFSQEEIEIGIGQTISLIDADAKYIVGANRDIDYNFLSMLTWKSDNGSVVVNNGVIEGVYTGSANVTFTNNNGHTQTIRVTVTDEIFNDPANRNDVPLDEIGFSSYYTIFAFNNDIDYSEIGESGQMYFFDGSNASIIFYPSEMVKLNYYIKPYNLANNPSRYTLRWSSSDSKVATVDDQGYVTAIAEGSCQIFLRITVDGRLSTLVARCDIEVKSEFIIENRTLIAYKGNGGRVVIPDDEGIIYIGSFAFSHYYLDNAREIDDKYDIDQKKDPIGANEKVTEVVIPEGVEDINIYAFYGLTNLKKVEIASSTIKNIRQYAFAYCAALTDINLTEVDSILDYAFYGCEALTCYQSGGIDLSNVSFIGKHAFDGCTSMTSINLKNLRRSGEEAFANCTSLVSVKLGQYARVAEGMFKNDASITSTANTPLVIYSDVVPDNAFSGCKLLQGVRFAKDLTYLGDSAFENCSSLRSVKFDGDCEVFGDGVFYGCASLTSLELPNCDMEFGSGVFQGSGLSTLIFQKDSKIVKAGVGVFYSLTNLTIQLSNDSSYYLENNIVYDSSAKQEIIFVSPSANLGNYVLPDSVEKIADSAFSGNTTLRTFTAGSNLREIGYGALSFCTNLTTVTLPANIDSLTIGGGAFQGSRKLATVVNLDSATYIGEYAFVGTAITSAKIGDDAEIGEYAFEEITSLSTVDIGNNVKIGEGAFAFGYMTSVTLGKNVEIGYGAFWWCDSLTEIDLTDVAFVDEFAFYACIGLKRVNLANVTELSPYAFSNCISLTAVDNAGALTSVGEGAFYGYMTDTFGRAYNVPLETIDLSNVKEIGDGAFMYTSITQADLTNVVTLGISAFFGCSDLSSVEFGQNLKVISDDAFGGCRSLVIGQDDLQYVKEIGEGAFMATWLPVEFNLAAVEKLGDYAFAAATFTDGTVITPATVRVDAPRLTEIGKLAFAGCEFLESINAPKLQVIGASAFTGTAIVDIELTDNFQGINTDLYYAPLDDVSNFVGFYVMVDGKKSYDYENDTFVLDDGVLYTKLPNGYLELSIYPMGKTDTSYTVLENTVRIDKRAATDNMYLTKIILPMTLKSIGSYAFSGCENLSTVVFRSYYAPVLEGTMFDTDYEITNDTMDNYESGRVDTLYKYDFYFNYYHEASFYYQNLFMYSNFVAEVTSKAASNITCVIPESSEGYDSPLYKAYFTYSETETSGKVRGRYVIDFIAAMEALPATIDRYAVSQMEAAITAYNMLMANWDEVISSDEKLVNDLIAIYSRAVVVYHVDTVTHIIAKLYDMDATSYSYNALRSAFEAYNALTDEEKALVTNASILDTKLADLEREMGQKVDFSKEFEDYDLGGDDDPTNNLALIISLSVVGGVLVIGAAVFVTLWLLKKKKASNGANAEQLDRIEQKIDELEQKQDQLEQHVEQLEQQKSNRKKDK